MIQAVALLLRVITPQFALFSLILFLAIHPQAQAQKKPSTRAEWIKSNKEKVLKQLMGIITTDPVDENPALNVKSEDIYLPYAGKIIRKIIIRRIGFERTVLDTARHFQTFVSRAANRIHIDTKEFVIRDNLFIHEGKPLNPYRVADNERTLRNLSFVLDSRILVKPISRRSDSVDLIVITRDVFSLGGNIEPQSITKYKLGIQEANLGGMGQRVQFNTLYDVDRIPKFGYEAVYQKTNIVGSFVDGTIGYSSINTGTSVGNENERAFFLRLSRPLFHPFARWAGGLELSTNYSTNVFKKPDSTFATYHYDIQDYWAGYSFGLNKMPSNLRENRNRKFIAFRAFEQHFSALPTINLTEPDRYAYRNRIAFLSQLTFFRQDFYKTQYVIGFGRTEDIPHGYRASLTGGYETEMEYKRLYLGSELYYTRVMPSGTILTYTGKLASYFGGNRSEDGLFLLNFSRYSKVYEKGSLKIRHQMEVGFAMLFNQNIKRGIDVRDVNGILGFSPDSLVGTKRFTISQEAVIFTSSKILGFRLAPVARIDMALINRNVDLIRSENFFTGISAGIRARNENLIFNTIEARVFFYPRVVERIQHLSFSIGTNIRIKYPNTLVTAPSTVFN
ncbi:MAG: hypothetical protein HOP08_14100 [Cyclobacteriaceae bacterium]|nr:hypothetical protein [Cyclobacteriaceae bacterium]